MFQKTYGNLTISETTLPKRGFCLQATRSDNGFSIYFDVAGMMVPEGVNCYLFGNKAIFVTLWNNFTEAEKSTVLLDNISLGVFPARKANHFVIKYGSFAWGDVFAYHSIIEQMNDLNKPVEQAIFIFYDKQSGEFVGERSVVLPEQLANTFAYGNQRAFAAYTERPENLQKLFADINDPFLGPVVKNSLETDTQDWCDILYDESFAAIGSEAKSLKEWAPEEIVAELKGTILIEIEGDKVIEVMQN